MFVIKKAFNLVLNRSGYCSLVYFLSLITFTSQAHDGHAYATHWFACEYKKLNDSCNYLSKNTLYKGSCRSIKSAMMCVKNQPLVMIKRVNEQEKTDLNNSPHILQHKNETELAAVKINQ